MMSATSGDSPCAVCSDTLHCDSHALCCNMCEKWAHVACLNISEKVYKLFSKFECNLPWFCPSCLEEFRVLKAATAEIMGQNQALCAEVTKLRGIEENMLRLQSTVRKLAEDVSFLMQDNNTHQSDQPSTPTNIRTPTNIPVHTNPFHLLDPDPEPQDQILPSDCTSTASPTQLADLPSLQLSSSLDVVSTSLDTPQQSISSKQPMPSDFKSNSP